MGQHVDLVRSSLPASQQLILEAVEETVDGIVFRVREAHAPLSSLFRIPSVLSQPLYAANARLAVAGQAR
jgi:hypothetical protein